MVTRNVNTLATLDALDQEESSSSTISAQETGVPGMEEFSGDSGRSIPDSRGDPLSHYLTLFK
ncbi:MAG: hypothetical protein Q9167_008079, partial [Letrouitia subvulpina]